MAGPWEIGTRDDPESAAGSGTLIPLAKRHRTLLGQIVALLGGTGTLDVDPVTATPTAYNVTLTVANTEYNQAMPANCRGFEFQCRTEADVRYAFVTGRVAGPAAPWLTLKAGDYYFSPPINQAATPSTLYLATPTAGSIVEILAWV